MLKVARKYNPQDLGDDKMMFSVSDVVVFGSADVYEIVDICQKDFGVNSKRSYYVLNPVFGNSLDVYIPINHKQMPIRKILTKEEIVQIIKSMPDIKDDWIEDYKQRKATYSEILASGDHEKIIRIIKIIHIHQLELEQQGKQLISTDKELLKAAEKLIYHEFAAVLDLEPEQIIDYILQKIGVYHAAARSGSSHFPVPSAPPVQPSSHSPLARASTAQQSS